MKRKHQVRADGPSRRTRIYSTLLRMWLLQQPANVQQAYWRWSFAVFWRDVPMASKNVVAMRAMCGGRLELTREDQALLAKVELPAPLARALAADLPELQPFVLGALPPAPKESAEEAVNV